MRKLGWAFVVVSFAASAAALPASANPVFSRTESGSIQIEENGTVYNIYSADRSIGAFESFSNAAGETINSVQASPTDTALFRVIGGEPSRIFGALNANSRVFLVNPNGVLFGPGSSVNAPGLVASALGISNADFLARNYAFEAAAGSGAVVNQGVLSGEYYVVLLGKAVANEGVIRSSGGKVALAAGDSARLLLDGEGLVSIDVTAATASAVYGADGQRLADQILNSGSIQAAGGCVLIEARAAEGVFDNVINHSGVIEARSVGERDGVVVLDGGGAGVVRVSGTIDASGRGEGETGGSVRVLGDKVGLFGAARIDASGDSGGGEALVGGDAHGANPGVRDANFTYGSEGASIDVRAIRAGDGGKAIVWADQADRFYGSIDARGGALSGNGGFVETSGEYLDVNGARVMASAANGDPGTWLLDPLNIEIQGSATANVTDDNGSPLRTFTPNNITATLLASTVNGALDGGTNVKITTNGTTGAENGDIIVDAAITKTVSNSASLLLDAAGDILLNSPVNMSTGFLELKAVGAINGDANNGMAEIITTDSVKLTADRIGDVHQLEIFFTDASGTQTLEVDSKATAAGHDVDMELLNDNFEGYTVKEDSVFPDVSIDLPNTDFFSVTGGAMTATLTGITLNSSAIKPTLDYVLNGTTGDVAINTITLDAAKSLSIEAVNGSILNNSSNITAGAVTLTAGGSIGTLSNTIKVTASSVTATAGDDIGITASSGNLTLKLIAADEGAADVSLTATVGAILDGNGDALNIDGADVTLSSASTIGTTADAIEARYDTLSTPNNLAPNTVFVTRIVDETGETGGLQITGGRVTGGENIEEFTTSLYGEEGSSGGEEETSEDEDKEKEASASAAAAGTGESAAVEEPPADSGPAPVDAQTFSPCGV